MNKNNGINDKSISDINSNYRAKEYYDKDKTELSKIADTRIIDDDMDVKLYNGFPILEELIDEQKLDLAKFEVKKWKSLSTKNRNYYLYNKIEYYKNFKLIKEKQNIELEKIVNEKNLVLKKLKEEIQIKEEEHQKVRKLLNVQLNDNLDNQLSKKNDDRDIYKQKLREFPIKIANLDKKIEEVDKLLNHYKSDKGISLDDIISGLKEEKKRIKEDKEKLTKSIDEIHFQIKDIKESIRILELKNINSK